MIGGEVELFLSRPVCQLLENRDDQLMHAVNTFESIYRTIINDHMPKILESINICKIIQSRIKEMEANETEKLIFQVMYKDSNTNLVGELFGCMDGICKICNLNKESCQN